MIVHALPPYRFMNLSRVKVSVDIDGCWGQTVFQAQEGNLNMLCSTSTESRNISCPNIHKRSGSLQNIL